MDEAVDNSNKVGTNVPPAPISHEQIILKPIYSIPVSPPSYDVSQALQSGLLPANTLVVEKVSDSYSDPTTSGTSTTTQAVKVRDYMTWSVINMVLGFMLGAVALGFSILTRNRLKQGDIQGAIRMSRITFLFNIIATISFFLCTAGIITYLFYLVSYSKSN